MQQEKGGGRCVENYKMKTSNSLEGFRNVSFPTSHNTDLPSLSFSWLSLNISEPRSDRKGLSVAHPSSLSRVFSHPLQTPCSPTSPRQPWLLLPTVLAFLPTLPRPLPLLTLPLLTAFPFSLFPLCSHPSQSIELPPAM